MTPNNDNDNLINKKYDTNAFGKWVDGRFVSCSSVEDVVAYLKNPTDQTETIEDEEDLDYDKDLILYLSYGSFFGGVCIIKIIKIDEYCANCSIHGFNGWNFDDDFNFPLAMCNDLVFIYDEVRNWRNKYRHEHDITDGYSWVLELNLERHIKKKGYAATPDDFKKVINKILSTIDTIRDSYELDNDLKEVPLMEPFGLGFGDSRLIEGFFTGAEIKDTYKDCYYCDKGKEGIVRGISIPNYLDFLILKTQLHIIL